MAGRCAGCRARKYVRVGWGPVLPPPPYTWLITKPSPAGLAATWGTSGLSGRPAAAKTNVRPMETEAALIERLTRCVCRPKPTGLIRAIAPGQEPASGVRLREQDTPRGLQSIPHGV